MACGQSLYGRPIFFRGTETSRTTSDANRDLDCRLKYMPVPPLLKKIIEDNAEANKDSPLVDTNGKAIKSIPVHSGFYRKYCYTF